MTRAPKCKRCGRQIASRVEKRALRKLRDLDPDEWLKLTLKRCYCPVHNKINNVSILAPERMRRTLR